MPKSRLEQNLNNLRKTLNVPQPIMVGGEAVEETEIEVEPQEQSVHYAWLVKNW